MYIWGRGVPLSLVPYGEHRCKNDVHKVELSQYKDQFLQRQDQCTSAQKILEVLLVQVVYMRKLLKLLDIFEVNLIFCIIPNLFLLMKREREEGSKLGQFHILNLFVKVKGFYGQWKRLQKGCLVCTLLTKIMTSKKSGKVND